MQAWVEIKLVASLADIERKLETTSDQTQRAFLERWKEESLLLIPKDSQVLNRYNSIKEKKKDPILHVDIQMSAYNKKILKSVPCPGCFMLLPTADYQHLQRMDSPVFCQNCSCILYSEGFVAHTWRLDQKNIDKGEVHIPSKLNLGKHPIIRDMYGKDINVSIENGVVKGLRDLLSSYAVKKGDFLKLRVLSISSNEYAFVREIKSIYAVQKEFPFEEVQQILDESLKVYGRTLINVGEISKNAIDPKPANWKHRLLIDEDSISRGIIKLPIGLADRIGGRSYIYCELRPLGEFKIEWMSSARKLKGLGEWYSITALEPGDYVNIEEEKNDNLKLNIWTEWQRSFHKILEMESDDLTWQDIPARDCLIYVMRKLNREAHYRELYAEISRHRKIAVGTTIATLSKYRNILFLHVGKGCWSFLEKPSVKISTKEKQLIIEDKDKADWEKIWALIEKIEAEDLVYQILKRRAEPLSFEEICRIFGEEFGIDANLLKETGFINSEDSRLERDDTGSWILKEWISLTETDGLENIQGIKEESQVEGEEIILEDEIEMTESLEDKIEEVTINEDQNKKVYPIVTEKKLNIWIILLVVGILIFLLFLLKKC